MPIARLSRRAESDLVDIGSYTLEKWGKAQANSYLQRLEDCFQLLAGNPLLGRACDTVRPGLRRMECGSHVVFYRHKENGIVISRILHVRMIPQRHDMLDVRDR